MLICNYVVYDRDVQYVVVDKGLKCEVLVSRVVYSRWSYDRKLSAVACDSAYIHMYVTELAAPCDIIPTSWGIYLAIARVKFSWIPDTTPPSWDGIRHLSWKIRYLNIEIRHPVLTGNLSISIAIAVWRSTGLTVAWFLITSVCCYFIHF